MTEILPFDLGEIIHQELLRDRRPNDHLLHASSHIMGSLRHAQLDVAGAPKKTSALLDEFVLKTGTLWHEWIHNTLRGLGVPYMAEVNLTPWLPKGWGGTADALVWHPELKAFTLLDFKTIKGEGMKFIRNDGAKSEHIAQASAYWYAARKMGLPMVKRIGVLYLPKNATRDKDELIEALLVDFVPLAAKPLDMEMKRRAGRVSEYITSLGFNVADQVVRPLRDYLTDALEPVQERVQKKYLDRATGTWDVKLIPHWSAAYCPFSEELCGCGTQGSTKIGFFDTDGEYIPRKGFEDVPVTVEPPEPTWRP